MTDHIQKTIEDAHTDLRKKEQSVVEAKRFINQLCKFGSMDLMYPDAEGDQATTVTTSTVIRRNSYYGKPLATCVRAFLEMRKSTNQSHSEASLEEIMNALRVGSFDLEAISKDEDGQKRGVAISLAKNTVTFHRLPNGDFGLVTWYSNLRKTKSEKTAPLSDVQTASLKATDAPPLENIQVNQDASTEEGGVV